MGQAVPDKGEAFQDKGDTKQRGAEGYQDTYDKGIAYKGILQIQFQSFYHCAHCISPPSGMVKRLPMSLSIYSCFVPRKIFSPICRIWVA